MVSIQKTNTPFTEVLLPLSKRSGFISCRYIGFEDETKYYEQLNALYNKLLELPLVTVLFDGKIPMNKDFDLTNAIDKALLPMQKNDVLNGNAVDLLKNLIKINSNSVIIERVLESLKNTLVLYAKQETVANISIAKNFINKLVGWMLLYVPQMFEKDSEYNPKVLFYGNIKPHEVYFLVFLLQIGCDILFLNPTSDEIWQKIDSIGQFSYVLEGKKKGVIKEFPKERKVATRDLKERIVVIHKESNNILEDFLLPVTKRSGYVGNPLPVIPTFFYRYLGCEGMDEEYLDEYRNELYRLDKKLQMIPNKYLKFLEHIQMPSYDESGVITPQIEQKLNGLGENGKETIINVLISLLPDTKNEVINNTIIYAFQQVAQYFLKKENPNISTYKNFLIKLVLWIRRYWGQLQGVKYEEYAKILFYGEIKPHEVYLLLFFNQVGYDVLIVSPDKRIDGIIQRIDDNNEFSRIMELKNSTTIEPFPTTEKAIRKTTIAYDASHQIESVIYGADVGIFKPWQLAGYQTSPITLKTTYDELKILWKEESKVRSEFRVEGDTVYIPNLFAKVNGVTVDINDYWKTFNELANAPNTLMFSKMPFTNIGYARKELFASAFLFDKQDRVDYEAVIKSPIYKFSYLNTSLQRILIQKVNELIASERFNVPVDDVFKLKILMTVLTLDDRIVKLIERFDYPSYVPKIVIYDNQREFSDEDAIVLAYLNMLGLDIIVFTPTNYNTLEQKISEKYYDVHQLDSVAFDLELPELSGIGVQEKSLKKTLLKTFLGIDDVSEINPWR